MSTLYVIRHGQASFLEQNYDKLSALGETQARMLGEYWAKRRVIFDRILSGPRTRQMETARITGEACKAGGLPWPAVEVVPEFDEYHGEAVLDTVLPGLTEHDPQIRDLQNVFLKSSTPAEKHRAFQRLFEIVIGRWVAGEIRAENIESWADFSARVNRGLSQIAASSGKGQQVAVFTSGGPIGITMQFALHLSAADTLRVAWMVRNGAYNEFLFSGERFTLSSFNAFPHLDGASLLTYR